MDKIFEISKIDSDGDIILKDNEFDKFVNEMNLPVFRKKFEAKSYTSETLYTIFNGRILRGLIKVTKK
ncbi:hypothetical protein KAU33_16090 [Candidatus Dependentiae bacterium]|nr:hypothetical protein [Candidatus Dependentiae bacterium]